MQLLYLKPVQTGFPTDSDARLVVSCALLAPAIANALSTRTPLTTLRVLANKRHATLQEDTALPPVQGAVIGASEECGPHAAALLQGGGGSSGYSSDADTDLEGARQSEAQSVAISTTAQTLFAWSAPASPHLTVQREGAAPPAQQFSCRCLTSLRGVRRTKQHHGSCGTARI